ncbi:MAG: hypothetical protein OCD02_02990 [Spirochaetaceae bacterium]
MKDKLTLANINLYAVLRNLEDLCEMDLEMKDLIKDKNIRMQISVKNGPKGILRFKDGKCTFEKGKHPNNVKLILTSPEHFNKMVDGEANPIPVKGFTKLNFLLKDFTVLTDKLSYYLKPTPELLKDKHYAKINTTLTAYTAFFALAEIGNTDPMGKLNGGRIPDGNISVTIKEGPAVCLNAKAGFLTATKGIPQNVRAAMTFEDMKTAGDLLNGNIDSYTCVATKTLKLKGFLPMLDNMNKILGQVPAYL